MTSLTKTGAANYVLQMVLLFALTPLVAKSQPAIGTWIEIHVNGPWDYLPYPANATDPTQFVLIAPATKGHDAPVYLSGPHADQDPDASKDTKISSGLHALTISTLLDASNCPSYFPPPIKASVYDYPNVPSTQIQAAIDGTAVDATGAKIDRFAVILPQPNYISGYDVSYSSIDVQPINNPARHSKPYTTWMVLHYCVDANSIQVLYDKTTSIDVTSSSTRHALSFVMRSDMSVTMHTKDCDDKSIASVVKSAALLGLTGHLYGLFPELTDDEMHQTATYLPGTTCRDLSITGASQTMILTKSQAMPLLTAGSGDCHKPPIVINGAIE